jgi:hypothetical protein
MAKPSREKKKKKKDSFDAFWGNCFSKKGNLQQNTLFSENCVAFRQFVTKKKKRVNKGIIRMGPALGYGQARTYYVSTESHCAS